MKNKGGLNNLKKYFFKSSTHIFWIGLDYATIAVFCYLSAQPEKINPSVLRIARHLKMHKDTASRCLKILQDRNIIQKISDPTKGVATKYKFIHPDEWIKGEGNELTEQDTKPTEP